jgi:two-component system, chemotaxis family, CheB/CheR fusion protein
MRVLPAISADGATGRNRRTTPAEFAAPGRPVPTAPRSDRRLLLRAYDAVLERHAPPSLLVTRSGELLHVFGDGQKYLRLRPGLFSSRLVDVVIEPLKLAITACIDLNKAALAVPLTREVSYQDANGEDVELQIRTETLGDDGQDGEHLLIVLQAKAVLATSRSRPTEPIERFEEHAAQQQRIDELERNLTFTEESLQTTIEELETSNEELQSTNEELMSANEELQSSNEELHAVNEELYSVSSEHQRKIDELIELTHDMDHLFRSSDVGTIFLDQDLKIRRYTPAVAMAFNLLERDIGRPIEHITARFSYPELKRDVLHVISTGAVVDHTVGFDNTTLMMRIFPYQISDRTRGIVMTLVDVSRLKQAERALELRNHELARLNASLEQFTYIVSHDLRAPLRTILNSAKWIEEDLEGNASEEIRGHCSRLMTYTNRLTEMLDDLMRYSRLEEGGQTAELIDVRELVASIVETIDPEQRLHIEWRGDFRPFRSSRSPLRQVFQNLLDNALKYSNLPKTHVFIGIEDLGSQYRFLVTDNGPGIQPRHHEKIFLPFRKLEHKDDKPGTGMGLALVKKAIEDNNGHIDVISDPDERPGTTFRFTWPKLPGRSV